MNVCHEPIKNLPRQELNESSHGGPPQDLMCQNAKTDELEPLLAGNQARLELVGSGSVIRVGRRVPRVARRRLDQGSSAFFWEIRRRTRSASRAPSNGFLNASLKPSEKVSSPGSSLVSARRMVP